MDNRRTRNRSSRPSLYGPRPAAVSESLRHRLSLSAPCEEHPSVAVSGIAVSGTSAVLGIAIASGGMFLAFGQVAIGNRLRQAQDDRRSRLRRLHLALMLILSVAALTHLVLNGPVMRTVLRL